MFLNYGEIASIVIMKENTNKIVITCLLLITSKNYVRILPFRLDLSGRFSGTPMSKFIIINKFTKQIWVN